MVGFSRDLQRSEEKLKKEVFWSGVLTALTLGCCSRRNQVKKARQDLENCRLDLQKFQDLSEKNKTLDRLLDKVIEISGVRVSEHTFSDIPVNKIKFIGGVTYPEDWDQLRKQVLQRDDFRCIESDGKCHGPLQIHHALPLSQGGSNDLSNLATLCKFHHSMKHPHMR